MGEIMGEHELGRFTGKLALKPVRGQQMKTTQEFGFLDTDGRHWSVPPGTSVNGASIPKVLWSWLGEPLQGQYRQACVVHDHQCSIRSVDWRSVHRMFYRAMRVSGVSEQQAKLAYAGVYFAGPRWGDSTGASVNLGHPAVPTQTAPGNILYALCRDPITLAVSEALECDGTSAFNWITSEYHSTNPHSEITLGLDKLSEMVEEDAPSLRSLEAAIDYSVSLIPSVEGAPRRLSIGHLANRD